jgi:two-component system, OmpR family, sensor histidine kinase BaeS
MSRSLTTKLILAFLFVGLIGAALVAIFTGQYTQREFGQFVYDRFQADLAAELGEYYQKAGSWRGINLLLVRDFSRRPSPWGINWSLFTLIDADRTVIRAGVGHKVGELVPRRVVEQAVPITVEGATVGWLLVDLPRSRNPMQPDSPEAAFLANLRRAVFFGALGSVFIALLVGVVLARTISRPVSDLTAATRAIAAGDLGHQVAVHASDELGELALSFNQMSADLERASDLRRQMTADIAHELRTPLSVIMGYTEALADGKLPGTAEMFGVMHDEARRLSRLVDDLRTLSLADAGELPLMLVSVDPGELLERTALIYRDQAGQQGISLEWGAPADLPPIVGDPDRLAQVLGNLVGNALRYTPAGGAIRLSGEYVKGTGAVRLSVGDTGSGIPSEDLPHIFDRFYRGDRSRQRADSHESGLGLAIARSLVEAQGGRLTVVSRVGEGSVFTAALPAAQAT